MLPGEKGGVTVFELRSGRANLMRFWGAPLSPVPGRVGHGLSSGERLRCPW